MGAVAITHTADVFGDIGAGADWVREKVCIGASDEVVAPNPAEGAEHFAGRIDPRMAA
jgi:hypothetical protein